jgi:hypothetical protein
MSESRVIVPTQQEYSDALEQFASSLTPLGLPYPEPSAPLNQGANDIKALALAVDNKLTIDAITHTVPSVSLVAGANNQWTLTGIPTGRLVAFSAAIVDRMAQGQYVVNQVFDGTTNVTGDVVASSGSTAGASNMLVTMVIMGYRFTNPPVLKVFASSSGQTMDAIVFRGIAWR